jgi:hypothetical protein
MLNLAFNLERTAHHLTKFLISFRYKTELAAQTPTMAQAKSEEE